MLRRIVMWGAVIALAVALFGSMATLRSTAKNGHRPTKASELRTLPAQFARGHAVRSTHVNLGSLPNGYEPGIDEQQALQLALDQLGEETDPTSAQAFLGVDDHTGLAVWIVTFENVCGQPNAGPPDNGLPACADNTLSVVLGADAGEYIGAY